jgi:2-polyprenyl-6-methoxyphenol hydroxylase-like FAD-dependent oxidoreductase
MKTEINGAQTHHPGRDVKIIIVGAGVGGLVTALHLHAHGFTNIHIFEAVSRLRTLGVGINIQPSAVLILQNLGLLEALDKTGIRTKDLNYYNRFGHPIISEKRGVEAGYAVPQFSMHRGELQMLLMDTVKERLGADRIHLGHALSSFEQSEDKVTAHFLRRSDPEKPCEVPSIEGDLIVAADGINSAVRSLLYPHEGPPRFSGRILWRGCIERAPYLSGASMVWAGHANQKFIAYPISARSVANGRSFVNWIAELRVRKEDDPDLTPPPADWNRPVAKSVFEGPFQEWTFGFLDCKDLIDSTDTVYEFPMCDRDPVDQWSFGRLTLLGDAAHPMYPIGSNGASQAILDAECLTTSLISHPIDILSALKAYQDTRLPLTAKIVIANRGNGPDHVMQVTHERAPNGFAHINDVIDQVELEDIGKVYKAIAGFEIDRVNAKAKDTAGTAERLGLRSPKAWTI